MAGVAAALVLAIAIMIICAMAVSSRYLAYIFSLLLREEKPVDAANAAKPAVQPSLRAR